MDPVPAQDALTTLLSTDALLVAASTLAATIGHAPPPNTPKSTTPWRIATGVAWLMVVVSAGALAAWIDLYLVEDGFDNIPSYIVAFALLAILFVIPVIGFQAARWAKAP
jgi:hypothetical protein